MEFYRGLHDTRVLASFAIQWIDKMNTVLIKYTQFNWNIWRMDQIRDFLYIKSPYVQVKNSWNVVAHIVRKLINSSLILTNVHEKN